jgi:hypothetical protein
MNFHADMKLFIDILANRTLFGFVRNPFDWYVSFWVFSQKNYAARPPHDSHPIYKYLHNKESLTDINIFINRLINERTILDYYRNGLAEDTKPELAHIDLGICQDLDIGLLTYRYLYVFYAPQVFKDLEHYKDYKIVDEVLRFENLREELSEFLSRYDIKGDTMSSPKVNCSPHDMYELYYDKETIDMIYHKDRIIFEEFDYSY